MATSPVQRQLLHAASQLASLEAELKSMRTTIDSLAAENKLLQQQRDQLQFQLDSIISNAEPPSE